MRDEGLGVRLTRDVAVSGGLARSGLAAVAGAVAGFGQAPFGLVPLAIAGLFLGLAIFEAAQGWRRAVSTGWAFGTGYFALTLFWIIDPFLVDAPRHGWMAPFALVLMAGGLALFWAAAFGLARALAPRGPLSPLAWAVLLTASEGARSYVMTGFPWALIGHVWIDTGALAWAAHIGPLGLTFATLGLVAGTWVALARRRAAWWLLAPVPFAALVLAPSLMPPAAPVSDAPAPVVRLVQPNAAQNEKWDISKLREFYERQIAFTAAAPEGQRAPDLIVWPETAIPWLLEDAGPALEDIAAAAGGRPVVLGLQRREGARYFNSLAALGPTGEVAALYDKHHLVPFGEYIPFGELTRFLGLRSFAARDGYGYSPGPGAALIDLGPLGRVLPLICYEAIFPQDLRAAPGRPDWILQITNDGWFGKLSGPYQHLAQARLRAVEQGLPVTRVANTGVSAVIDPRGRVLVSIPLGQAGWVDQALPPPLPATFYARTGDWPVAILLSLLLAALLLRRRRFSH